MCLRESPGGREAGPELWSSCCPTPRYGSWGKQVNPHREVRWKGGAVLLATSPSHLGCKSRSPALKWPLGLKAYLLKLLAAQRNQSFCLFLHLRKSLYANLKSMAEREHRNKRKVENVFDNFIEKYWVTPFLYSLSFDFFSPSYPLSLYYEDKREGGKVSFGFPHILLFSWGWWRLLLKKFLWSNMLKKS